MNSSASAAVLKQSEALRAAMRGRLLGPGDGEYDSARQIHNGMIDRRPAWIARCAGAADVQLAVNFARVHQLPVSVMGGGHGVSGFAVSDGGLMIDLSGMKNIQVDPQTRTAAQKPAPPGATSTARLRRSAWRRPEGLNGRPESRA
jgi:hypothetical protein